MKCMKGEQGVRGRGAAPDMSPFFICLKRELLKLSFWRECGRSVRWSVRPVFSSLSCLLWVRTHLMFELVGLNDRAASERHPQAPALPGFQRPSEPVAVGLSGRRWERVAAR